MWCEQLIYNNGVTLKQYLAICLPLKSDPWRTVEHAKASCNLVITVSACDEN